MEYLVTWAIDVEAASPLEAAELAEAIFLGEDITPIEGVIDEDPPRWFHVKAKEGGEEVTINLTNSK